LPKVQYERRGRVALFTLEGDNDLNLGTIDEELYAGLIDYRDDPELWCAVVTGAGQKAFCAGADLKALAARGFGSFWDARPLTLLTGVEFWKPLIAAINGYCLGNGLMFALACDIRIATDAASFSLPEVKYGFPPGQGATQRLPRVLPLGPALQMLLTGERISAEEALRWGLVNRLVAQDQLVPEAMQLAEKIAANPPLAVRACKELALRGLDLPLPDGLRMESMLGKIARETEDAKEGPRAFAEKRPPVFNGR
jgi:E-phenylitaconyl-CoA hydratase